MDLGISVCLYKGTAERSKGPASSAQGICETAQQSEAVALAWSLLESLQGRRRRDGLLGLSASLQACSRKEPWH